MTSGLTLYTHLLYTALGELGLSSVHTIAVAFPFQADIDEFKLDQATPIWKEAELLLNEGVANEMGVADLNKERLEALYNATTVKPMINQINMAHCCVIPEVRGLNMAHCCVIPEVRGLNMAHCCVIPEVRVKYGTLLCHTRGERVKYGTLLCHTRGERVKYGTLLCHTRGEG